MDYEKKDSENTAVKTIMRMIANGEISQEVAEKYFPELAESEDEKIKDAVIKYVSACEWKKVYGVLRDDMLAWLEKQGEQKPADKVEPRFKVGDWVVHNKANFIFQVVSIGSYDYKVINRDNYTRAILFDNKENYHLWTIQDAKDGDVLCTYECGKPKIVFILKGAPKKPYVLGYHCFYNIMYPHFEFDSEKGCLAPNEEDVKPATKEQRDTLMKAMADAGYEWDAEKKELKKIVAPKFEVGDTMRTLQEVANGVTDGMPVVVSIDEEYYHCTNELIAIKDQDDYEYPPMNRRQKTVEDEENFKWFDKFFRAESVISEGKDIPQDRYLWFKNLKGRVQPQPKQEWGGGDEAHLHSLITHLEQWIERHPNTTGADIQGENITWLKSLRTQMQWKAVDKEIYVKEPALAQRKDKSDPFRGFVVCCDHTLIPNVYERFIMISDIYNQSHWKPSEEQIISLQESIGIVGELTPRGELLKELAEQLKKLREE